MTAFSPVHFTCMCGEVHTSKEAYAHHLQTQHGDTWLAKRVLREKAVHEKVANATSK